jgi:hypothetical protein
MATERNRLFAAFELNPPATEASVWTVEDHVGIRFPIEYVDFLKFANGGEGFIGEAYARFWRVEELNEMNLGYQVAEFAPGLFLFGSDGGGEAYAFDTGFGGMAICSVPFIPLDIKLAIPLGSNFNEFLETLFKS